MKVVYIRNMKTKKPLTVYRTTYTTIAYEAHTLTTVTLFSSVDEAERIRLTLRNRDELESAYADVIGVTI